MEFGELLRRERILRALTQEQLAEKAGLTSRSIRSLEAGSAKPRRATVAALGTALGLAPGKLQTLMWACGFGPRPGVDPSTAGSGLAQLPRGIPDFVGRGEVAAALAYELLSAAGTARPDGAPGIVAINGMGGIGKTTLATMLAHRVRTAFPDGQLFVDLDGTSAGGRDPDSVLAGMLRDLGVNPARIPVGVEAKSALLRSRTAGRSFLFLLDNARDSVQVRPLLPAAASCAVLVTSRRYLPALEGARHTTLEPFTSQQARELVEAVCGSVLLPGDEQALGVILARCAGLPLALRIAAARLAAPDGLGAAAFAEQLGQAARWLDGLAAEDLSVRGTFAVSTRMLAETGEAGRLARRALLFFGRWPGAHVVPSCLAAALSVTLPRAREALDHLVGTSLLQPPHGDKHAPHDLVRAYVAEQASAEPEPDGDQVRAAFDWYLHAMDRAVAVFADYFARPDLPGPVLAEVPDFADPVTALEWSEAEYSNVVALIKHGAAVGWDDAVPALAVLAMPFGEQRMRLSEWIETSRIGLGCARRGGDRLLEGRLLSNLVAAYRWAGEFASALECADAALAVFEELGARERIGVLLINRARIYHAAQDFQAAARAFREAVAFLRDHGDAHWFANALNQLGMALARAGEPQAGLRYQLESLHVARKENLGHYEGVVLLNLSISYILLGQVADADDAIEQAAAAAQGRGIPMLEAEIQRQTAEVRSAQGKVQEAIGLMRQALATMEELDYPAADEFRARLEELTSKGRV